MIKLEVEGKLNQVQPFLMELKKQPYIKLFKTGSPAEEVNIGEIRYTVFLNHEPSQNIKTIQLDAQNGQKILIPLTKVIQSEIEEGKWHLSGWHFDIFACPELSR